MTDIVISGTGLWHPQHVITNEQMVTAYNRWAERHNAEHAAEIESGDMSRAELSSTEFIVKASGIKARYAMFPEGICDPDRLMAVIPKRPAEDLSEMAEAAVSAGAQAIAAAGLKPEDIDMVICAASTMQRPWPAIAVEIQKSLGCRGFAFDMSVACSSATFALSLAADSIRAGTATRALIVNPEITTPQLNMKDRDSHFIFGDACSAMVVEKAEAATSKTQWRILGQRLLTDYSSNIRSEFGYMRRCQPEISESIFFENDMFFVQQGRKVFKELLPIVCDLIEAHLADTGLAVSDLKRFWLHQANINMNMFAVRKLLGRDAEPDEAPLVLDEFANTASAGSIIAFHRHNGDLKSGDKGLICSFGAGYSVGSVLVERV